MEEYYIQEVGAYLSYQDLPGEGVPILFIHGLGCAGSFDYPQVAAQSDLASHRRIFVDLLGAGYSDRPDGFDYEISSHAAHLKKFVESIGLTDFILFGHSLGGAVAVAFVALCTEKIKCIILCESDLDPSGDGSISKKITAYTEEDFIQSGFQLMLEESRNSGYTMLAAAFAHWSPAAVYRISRSKRVGGNPSWRKTFYELPMPKSFIFGEKSLPDEDEAIHKSHEVHIEIVEKAGHSMAWEDPAGLSKAIANSVRAVFT